jgi:hypothetical protein
MKAFHILTAILTFFLSFFLASFNAVAADNGRFTYRDPVFPKKRLTINVSERIFQIADVAIPMSVCGSDDDYICVLSDGFYFHKPSEGIESKRKWKADGIRYTSDSEETISLWGKSHLIWRINGVGKQMHIIYLYSKDAGLVGFSFVDKKSGAKGTYLLDEKCGFGASNACEK